MLSIVFLCLGRRLPSIRSRPEEPVVMPTEHGTILDHVGGAQRGMGRTIVQGAVFMVSRTCSDDHLAFGVGLHRHGFWLPMTIAASK